MTTRLQFVTKVRVELDDSSGSPLWSATQLNQFVEDGLNELSLDLPPRKEFTIAAVIGQRDYTIPTATCLVGQAGLISVQFPAGYVIDSGNSDPQMDSTVYSGTTPYYGQRWEFIRRPGDVQVLRFRNALTATGNITVRAYTSYTIPAADSDVLDVGVFDEVALKWQVCYLAYKFLDEKRGKVSGGPVPGRRGSQGEYQRLYLAALAARRRGNGIKSGQVVVNG
jgi:hypothetical protein